jgi:hypothetical protein
MITDKYTVKRSFSDAKKSLSPTSNSKIHPNPSIEQSDLSSLNSLNKNEHYKSASKNDHLKIYNMVTTTRPRSTAKLRQWQKSLLKSTILKVLKKSVTHHPRLSFGRDTTSLTKPRQRTIHKISLLIEYGRARFITHIVTHHTWPSQKGQTTTLNLPSFQNIFLISIFFQIWRFSFWRLFSVGDSIARFERSD